MAYQLPTCREMRPTLPPLHTLGLLDPLAGNVSPSAHESHDSHDQTIEGLDISRPLCFRLRQASISSTTSSSTASSRGTTPTDGPSPSGGNFSLVRTTFDKANALIVIPEVPQVPRLPTPPRSSSPYPSSLPVNTPRGKAFLVVGPVVEHFRHPERRLAKAARMHPYRIVPRLSKRTNASGTPPTNV